MESRGARLSDEDGLDLGDGFRVEIDVGRGSVLADLIGPRGADDRGGNIVLAQDPRECNLSGRVAESLGDRAEAIHLLQRCSSRRRPIVAPMRSLVARVSAGGGEPGRYLPVRTPSASGDQTIWEISFSRQSGITSPSGARQSSEYSGCDETNFSKPRSRVSSSERWISSGVNSLKPM